MYKELSDSELLNKLQLGNDLQKKEIFQTIYERYKNLVLKVCYYHLADYDLANDVFHDIFIKVIENAQTIANPALFKSWLMTIARNLCVDRLRRSSYLKGGEPLSEQIEVSSDERVEDKYVAELDRQKILNHLTTCVHSLEPMHLQIFKLRWKGKRAAEISKLLQTDKASLRRSYDQIKVLLEGCMQSKGLTISIDRIILLGELDE